MSKPVAFTDNYADLSNESGYQFEFRCERCGNGYRSPYVADVAEKGRSLLRIAGSLLGGKVSEVSGAAEQWRYDRGTNSKAKDKALQEAGEAVAGEFRQCRGCGSWVCAPVCWNDEVGQCLACSPSVAEELSKAQAEAQLAQIREKVATVDWTADVDITTRATVQCPSCRARTEPGKFCSECGEKLAPTKHCQTCGAQRSAKAKFCAECGAT